jgi:hypothetical protein
MDVPVEKERAATTTEGRPISAKNKKRASNKKTTSNKKNSIIDFKIDTSSSFRQYPNLLAILRFIPRVVFYIARV